MKKIFRILLLIIIIVSFCACKKSAVSSVFSDPEPEKASREESTATVREEPEKTDSTASEPLPDPSEDSASEETEVSEPTPEETEKEEPAEAESSEPEPEPEPEPAVTIVRSEEYELIKNEGFDHFSLASRQFHDGIAWATMAKKDAKGLYIGLINEAGEILYLMDQSHPLLANPSIEGIIATPFINGLSCVYTYESGDSRYTLPGFIIVDQNGKEVYTCFDDNMYMCGQAEDGNFIILKHESGFSADEWIFYVLDLSLTLKETKISTTEFGYGFAQSMGLKTITDGVYLMGNHILCLETESFYKPLTKNANHTYVGHGDRYACFLYDFNYYLVPFSLLKTAASGEELYDLMTSSAECRAFDSIDEYTLINYGFETRRHGIAYSPERCRYLDLDTGDVMQYPAFSENNYYFGIDSFRGGYAALYLIGADEKGYVTIIDEAGNVMYDPVFCHGFNTYTGGDSLYATSYNGFIFCAWSKDGWHMQIIDRSGKEKKIGDDLSELAGSFTYSDFSFNISIGERYIWISGAPFDFRDEYVSLDGKTVLDTVVANYNDAGELVYTHAGE